MESDCVSPYSNMGQGDVVEILDFALENLSLDEVMVQADEVMNEGNDVMDEDELQEENNKENYEDGDEYEFIDEDLGLSENLVPVYMTSSRTDLFGYKIKHVGIVNMEVYKTWRELFARINSMYLRRRKLDGQVYGIISAGNCWPGYRVVFDDVYHLDCFHEDKTPWEILKEEITRIRLVPL